MILWWLCACVGIDGRCWGRGVLISWFRFCVSCAGGRKVSVNWSVGDVASAFSAALLSAPAVGSPKTHDLACTIAHKAPTEAIF